MEKLKTNILIKISFLLFLMISATVANAQGTNYATNNDYTGNWTDDASWGGGTALGTTLGETEAVNVTIYGKISVSGLTISGSENVNITINDTLIIEGDLNIEGNFDLDITSTGFFIVRGDLSINTGGSASYDFVNNGFFGVTGNYNISGSETGGMNSDRKYVLGSSNSSEYTFRDRQELIENEDASTRKLLLGDAELDATLTPISPTCNGDTDGQIEVQGVGGSYYYQYSIDGGTTWVPSGTTYMVSAHTFTGLDADVEYTVTIRDDLSDEITRNVTITEKDPLALSVSGDSYFCSQSDVEFTVTPSGGNAPYTVSVTDQTDQNGSGPFTYSDLPDRIYTISVTDNEGCAPPPDETFVVDIDNALPQFETFPDDQQMLYSVYNTEANADLQEDVEAYSDNTTNSLTDGDNIDYIVDLSNYENPTMDFVFSVNGTPAADDYVRISYRYDGSNFTPLQSYDQLINSPLEDVALPLNALPSDNSSVTIRIVADFQASGSGLSYDFTSFVITADEVFSTDYTIPADETPTCSDDASGCDGSPTYDDDSPVWLCNSGTNKEFYFERTWTIQDKCGKSNTRTQIIGVGTPPTITAADNMVVDFCNNDNIAVPVPTSNDDCGVASVSWEVTDNTSGASPPFGVLGESDTDISLTLDHPSAGDPDLVYTITWAVIDDAGFTATDDQTITVKPAINIDIDYPEQNFCSGEQVTFNVTITGGTGEYLEPTSDISGIWGDAGDADNSTWTFTTSDPSDLGLEIGDVNSFSIDVNDATTTAPAITGGCPSDKYTFTDEGGEFDIHENISTNELERMP